MASNYFENTYKIWYYFTNITKTKINMWTSFQKKPISKAVSKWIPDKMPTDNNSEPNAFLNSSNQYNNNQEQINPPELLNINVESIVKQIQEVLKSPSPFTLYKKSTELKDNFAKFINYLAKKISSWFNSQNKTVILWMYQLAGYHHIWFTHLKNYLDEAKYFDLRIYFKAITTFDKQKQYLAKWLLKIYLWVKREEVEKFLKKFDSNIKYSDILNIYNSLKINEVGVIDSKYLNENKIEVFLEKIYFSENIDLPRLFQIFCFDVEQMRWKFSNTYEIFWEIAWDYLKITNTKTKLIYEYLESDENIDIMNSIEKQISIYTKNKKLFYKKVAKLFASRNSIERWYFWQYIKTRMIDEYFKEVSRLFYWDKNSCSNRNEWSQLKWNFDFSNKNIQGEISEIIQFKKLILELNTNIFAPFLKPLVYSIVSEKLSITRKDLLKIRYLMTLILSENYSEYKKIYNFFEDLEAFMDYNMEWFWINFGKIKIFAALIIIGFVSLVWLYIYSPVWVFVSSLVLSISYIRTNFFKFKPWIEWNFGVKPIATAVLIISSFYWITNLDSTKIDVAKLSSKVEKLWIYKTQDATKVIVKKLEDSWIKETIADILQSRK